MLHLVLESTRDNPAYLDDPKPRVVVVKLNDYNVALELQAWLENERDHIQQRFDLRESVFKALTDANVEKPLQTIQLAPHSIQMQATAPQTQSTRPFKSKE